MRAYSRSVLIAFLTAICTAMFFGCHGQGPAHVIITLPPFDRAGDTGTVTDMDDNGDEFLTVEEVENDGPAGAILDDDEDKLTVIDDDGDAKPGVKPESKPGGKPESAVAEISGNRAGDVIVMNDEDLPAEAVDGNYNNIDGTELLDADDSNTYHIENSPAVATYDEATDNDDNVFVLPPNPYDVREEINPVTMNLDLAGARDGVIISRRAFDRLVSGVSVTLQYRIVAEADLAHSNEDRIIVAFAEDGQENWGYEVELSPPSSNPPNNVDVVISRSGTLDLETLALVRQFDRIRIQYISPPEESGSLTLARLDVTLQRVGGDINTSYTQRCAINKVQYLTLQRDGGPNQDCSYEEVNP